MKYTTNISAIVTKSEILNKLIYLPHHLILEAFELNLPSQGSAQYCWQHISQTRNKNKIVLFQQCVNVYKSTKRK